MIVATSYICYEKNVAGPRRISETVKTEASPRWWASVAVSVGLGALVTGSFGLAGQWLVSTAQGKEGQCALAQQIVGDEALNPALSVPDRRRTSTVADARLLRCLGE
jgi:hypothetical protein